MKEYRSKMLSGRAFFTTRNIILLCVLLQNAGYTLVRKYSTITENVSSKEILLVAETIKMAAAVWFTVTDREKSDAQGQGVDKLIWLIRNSGKMLVLAAIYGTSNLSYHCQSIATLSNTHLCLLSTHCTYQVS